mmetsp:Transcript_23132/g.78774  ORF Transcript_23132/g.78774 Transcript_23132/m.78774 type:complete len:134 (+) Transcript_23132:1-402(+)
MLFLTPIPLYYAAGEPRFATHLIIVTFCSAMADAIAASSRFWNHLDHLCASTTYVYIVYRHVRLGMDLPDGPDWLQLYVTVAATMGALLWTRSSKTFDHYRWRQCVWHVVCSAVLVVEATDLRLTSKLYSRLA